MRLQGVYVGESNTLYTHGQQYLLSVETNALGGLQNKLPWFRDQYSITIRCPAHEMACCYKTISQFLESWDVRHAKTKTLRIPFLRASVAAGDAFERVAELFPLWIKGKFLGCYDRKYWWNVCLEFHPWREM